MVSEKSTKNNFFFCESLMKKFKNELIHENVNSKKKITVKLKWVQNMQKKILECKTKKFYFAKKLKIKFLQQKKMPNLIGFAPRCQ